MTVRGTEISNPNALYQLGTGLALMLIVTDILSLTGFVWRLWAKAPNYRSPKAPWVVSTSGAKKLLMCWRLSAWISAAADRFGWRANYSEPLISRYEPKKQTINSLTMTHGGFRLRIWRLFWFPVKISIPAWRRKFGFLLQLASLSFQSPRQSADFVINSWRECSLTK